MCKWKVQWSFWSTSHLRNKPYSICVTPTCNKTTEEFIHEICSHRPHFINDLRLLKFLPTLLHPPPFLLFRLGYPASPLSPIQLLQGLEKQTAQRLLSANVERKKGNVGVSARVGRLTVPCFVWHFSTACLAFTELWLLKDDFLCPYSAIKASSTEAEGCRWFLCVDSLAATIQTHRSKTCFTTDLIDLTL